MAFIDVRQFAEKRGCSNTGMRSYFPGSLRLRLVLLLGFLFLAMLALAAYQAYGRRQDSILRATERVTQTTQLVAEDQKSTIAYAVQFLSLLSETRDVREFATNPACSQFLAGKLEREPRFTNIAIVSLNGDLVCSAVPGVVNISDREYFRRALTASGAVIAEPVYGRASGKWTLPLVIAMRDAAGRVQAVFLISLDLRAVSRQLERNNYAESLNARLGLISQNGVVVARDPDPDHWLGKDASNTEFFRSLKAHGGSGSAAAKGFDGVERLYAFAPFAQTVAGPIYLWVGVSKQSVVRPAEGEFAWTLAWALVLLLLIFGVIWVGTERVLLQPVLAISDAARRLAKGDPQARSGIPYSNTELGQLARSFDDMAESLSSTSRLLEAGRALRTSEKEFRALAESMPQIVWITRADGWNIYFNHQWVEYTGLSLEESYGHGWNKPFHPDDQRRAWDAWQNAVRNNGTYSLECRLRKADGTYRWWLIRGVPAFDDQGKIYKWFGTCTDIEDIKQAEASVRMLNATLEQRVRERTTELEVANKELEAFAYSVSHDLRAPLRSIDGFSKILEEDYAERVDDEGKDALRRVRAAAQRMGLLIDDMLKLSRLSRAEMNFQTVNLSELVGSIVAELKAREPGRKVTFKTASRAFATGDRQLLAVLLENLLANAWKFTGKHAEAHIEFGVTEKDGATVYFVRDDGAGFDMAHIDKLFTPFQRLHGMAEFPGTGIGLATVQRIVRRHGGRAWAEGAVEKGATFYFTLGAREVEAPVQERVAALA